MRASTRSRSAHERTAAGQASEAVPPRYLGRDTWEIELLPRGSDASAANQQLVHRLRVLVHPAGALVGGTTAWFIDQKAAISAHMPLALVILVCVTLGTLFLMTGSVVLPLMALLMNLLTVAVGAGLLVLIFQDGHLSSLMGFSPIGGLEESNLVLLFTVAFALSTDYGVFLFARIKEAHDGGLATRDAVAQGLERTGRLITAAALLFCVAVGAFVTSHIFFIKQFGVGTALAVAIDATFVRALLVPALMGKLGERTWWAPRPLRRLHGRIGLHEEPRKRRSEESAIAERAHERIDTVPCMPTRIGLLGLGSNVGDRRPHLQQAVDALPAVGVRVLAASSVYDTDPVGEVLDQASFLNACLRVETELEPLELLDAVKRLERKLGREDGRDPPWPASDRHRHPAARRAGTAR